MVHFTLCKSTWNAEEVAWAFLRDIFSKHGLPENVTSDRDPKFVSHFWKSVNSILDIKLNMSSANHPQTDGQSERTIHTLEQYLRYYINYLQDDWDKWLPLAEFASNNHVSSTTKLSPFKVVYGFPPRSPMDVVMGTSDVPAGKNYTNAIQENIKMAQQCMREAQERYAFFADKGKKNISFKVGDKVLVSTKYSINDATAGRPSGKLRAKFMGPYTIIKVVSPVSYKLELPPKWKIHPVIYISQLQPYVQISKFSQQHKQLPPEFINNHEEYEIEKILNKHIQYYKSQYLMKWKGYGDENNMWLPIWKLDSLYNFSSF